MTYVQKVNKMQSMGQNIKTGESLPLGFTVIELMIVMVLVALLASIVTPIAYNSIQRAKEATLKENLHLTRRALDDYYADHSKYPISLESLVSNRYLRRIPVDPITERNDSWVLVRTQTDINTGEAGISDLKSGSDGKSLGGEHFKDW